MSSKIQTSSIGLSHLILLILGNLSAIPDLCLLEKFKLSKAISTTSPGFTDLTGPNLSRVLSLTHLSNFFNSSLVNPE